MANVRALRSGIWHDTNPTTSPWGSGGQVFFPTSVDDVWLNTFTVHLTANATVQSITNASATSRAWVYGDTTTAAAGGTLNLGNGTTFTGNINDTGAALCIVLSGTNSSTIVGNVFGTAANIANIPTVTNSGTGTLNVVGNVTGSNTVQANNHAITNTFIGTIVVTGSVVGSGSSGIASGINNASTGSVIVVGNVAGGNSGNGINNASTGRLSVLGNITAGAVGAVASSNGSATNLITGNILNAANGTAAIYAASYRIDPIPTNGYIRYARNGTGVGSDAWLYQYTTDSLSAFSMPPVSSVRLGTTFANGTLTGTCAMPSPASVSFGVPVDNTTGTATLNPIDIFSVSINSLSAEGTIGNRLRNSATLQGVGHLVASFNSN